jgi:hypothetical protein
MAEKHAGGRPRNHTADEVEIIKQLLADYIDETNIPILVEFAYQNDISRDDLYNYDEFCTLRKKAIDKKEAQLERLGLENKIDKTLAVFSLKQLGWRDRKEIEHSGDIVVSFDPAEKDL